MLWRIVTVNDMVDMVHRIMQLILPGMTRVRATEENINLWLHGHLRGFLRHGDGAHIADDVGVTISPSVALHSDGRPLGFLCKT